MNHSKTLLVPIPYVHIEAALQVVKNSEKPEDEVFAFGTSALGIMENFMGALEDAATYGFVPTLVFVTNTGFDSPKDANTVLHSCGNYFLEAELVDFVRADSKTGSIPKNYTKFRPTSTATDSAFIGYYMLRNLSKPQSPQILAQKYSFNKVRIPSKLRQPIFVDTPE